LVVALLCWLAPAGFGAEATDALAGGFRSPPDSAGPWVYWFWLNGNITKEGMTADLEAMKRAGIGGVLIMEVDQGAPQGPAHFMSPTWRELFKHGVSEAARLGLQVNMNNDGGWCGSGGPWITPDLAMQKVVWTETTVEGSGKFDGVLPQPAAVAGYYRDITVLAVPVPPAEASGGAKYRIGDIQGKGAFVPKQIAPLGDLPNVPAEQCVAREKIVVLGAKLEKGGRVSWEVPPGKWVLMRIGHTPTGKDNHPSPPDGRGLECDKLSREAAEAHFNGMMAKLAEDCGGLTGTTLISTHIDSWEVGSQNWTPKFREEFKALRGYDPLPYLPVLSGRVVDSLEVSERFLWDVRQTVSDLLIKNYAGRIRELAHQRGMRLSIEAYDATPCEDMVFAGQADEPMAEFWSWGANTAYSCTEMASAAHVYGKRILGAEAFTANDKERWLGHPAGIKALGDWAFCEGINRFVFHRYALQPWPDRRPGMSMGPWGLHYERTQTWWEESKAWHEYLARCQYLLQQGLFVADVCYVAPEGSPQRFVPPAGPRVGNTPDRPKYNYDGCPPDVVLNRMSVRDGRLVLPDGMSYRLLVLPEARSMTPALLRKVKELVEAGATVSGARPERSPGLTGYPQCDAEVRRLAAEVWGDCDSKTVTEHKLGKGRIVQGKTVEQILADAGVRPDFEFQAQSGAPALRYIHKKLEQADVYFVANKTAASQQCACSFRISELQPELWWPETGRIEAAPMYDEAEGRTRVSVRLEPSGSVFVIFRRPVARPADSIVSVARDGRVLLETMVKQGNGSAARADNNESIVNTFTMATWVKPAVEIELPQESMTGATLQHRRNDALFPPPGHEVYATSGQAGAGVSVGVNGVVVYEHGDHYFAPLLTWKAPLTEWTHVAVVYRDGQPSLYLNGKLAHTGLKSKYAVHPGVGVQHDRAVDAFQGLLGTWRRFDHAISEEALAKLMETTKGERRREQETLPPVELVAEQGGGVTMKVSQAGTYEIESARGHKGRITVAELPKPIELGGPWKLDFAPGSGAPASVTFDHLMSWSEHPGAGVKYFSGAATYRKTFEVPSERIGRDRRLILDFGQVEVMAHVRLNGKDLGTLWKPPYRLDVTDALRPGENTLEVKVVNLWVNRMIGDEQLPEDSDRNPNGTLKAWPKWLEEGKASPSGRYTFTSWRLWKKDAPLLPSGLLGPVNLRTVQCVPIDGR
jgi:hypothetical protein